MKETAMRKFSFVLALTAAALLTGCWQSDVSLYGARAPAQPFHAGRVLGRNSDGKAAEHSRLTLQGGGVYRLTNDEKGSSDFGDSFAMRFFALAGAPAGVFAFEAREIKQCKPSDNMCDPKKVDHNFYYGLARATGNGAEMINPDCGKTGAEAKSPGVTVDSDGICTFHGRASLDKALRALARTAWKPTVTYTFE
jgi:hypothetical protein